MNTFKTFAGSLFAKRMMASGSVMTAKAGTQLFPVATLPASAIIGMHVSAPGSSFSSLPNRLDILSSSKSIWWSSLPHCRMSSNNSTNPPSTKSATNDGELEWDEAAKMAEGAPFMPYIPGPVRAEFLEKEVTTQKLEELSKHIGLGQHRKPEGLTDFLALRIVKAMRIPADMFFRTKYLHRAVVHETVAGVPGMVAGVLRHLTSLRKMKHDGGWIHHLLQEAENERMHLLTFMKLSQPNWYERMLVLAVQGVFFNIYFFIYLLFPKLGHRIVGYLEEEAVISYTHFLKEIDEGRIPNVPAPKIAKGYWHLSPNATLRDVVLAVRADEAKHRDANHHLADRLKHHVEDLRKPLEQD